MDEGKKAKKKIREISEIVNIKKQMWRVLINVSRSSFDFKHGDKNHKAF
jgi:hypothetical protein